MVNPIPVVATPTWTIVQPTCLLPTGTITIALTSGLTYSFDNGATFVAANTKNGLTPNTYLIKVKNVAGCISSATSVVVNPIPVLAAPIASVTKQPTVSSPTGTITISSPATGVSYSFDNGVTYQILSIKSGLTSGVYKVKVKNNATTCESLAISLTVNPITAILSGTSTMLLSKNTPNTFATAKEVLFDKQDVSEDLMLNFNKKSEYSTVNIFPNPASNDVWLDISKYQGLAVSVSFYNSIGSLVLNEVIQEANKSPYKFNVYSLPIGSYFIRIQAKDHGTETKRLMIIR